jgi:hypothetical protein
MATHPNNRRSVSPEDITALRTLLSHTQAQVLTSSDSAYASSIARWSRAAE